VRERIGGEVYFETGGSSLPRVTRAAAAIALCALAGCRANAPARPGVQWSEADALFHKSPAWLGSDAAYSVPLSANRTLWLFGDTFVATSAANVRKESKMVRNTVAIQTGADPTTASIAFDWAAGPGSFFPDTADRWLWPLHGIRVENTLVLFFSNVKATPGVGLGFAGDGWRAAIIDNPDAAPADWHVKMFTPTAAPAGLTVGTAVVAEGDFVFALSASESGDHAGFLARWRAADLSEGKVEAIEWWNGSAFSTSGTPAKVMENAGPECSLHFDSRLKKFVHVRSDGFGKTTIVTSFADRPQGPWTAPSHVFSPPENMRDQAFVYAAKAHPELSAGGDLVVTYASNTFADFSVLVNDPTLYFPRFVRVPLGP
jgi:hypothetical protein